MVGLQQIRQVDMLPLLDIILVVLFVFATIEEGNNDESAQEMEKLQKELAETQALVELLSVPNEDAAAVEALRQENERLQKERLSKEESKKLSIWWMKKIRSSQTRIKRSGRS